MKKNKLTMKDIKKLSDLAEMMRRCKKHKSINEIRFVPEYFCPECDSEDENSIANLLYEKESNSK